MCKRHWSPYLCGILIGLLQIPVFFIGGSIGTSSATANAVCSVTNFFNGEQITACFKAPKSWWQLGLVIGIVIGAYLSKSLSKHYRKSISIVWQTALPKYSIKKRFLYAFIGGVLIMFGARLADGCTSGNGISGVALMSVGSVIVITFMFAAAIAVSFALYRR